MSMTASAPAELEAVLRRFLGSIPGAENTPPSG
jgi:hypothetical protein